MKIFNDEILISRNESFVYDRKIENKDGSPYIVSSQLTSPILRFTVADETYVANERYILNRYMELTSEFTNTVLPRFYNTRPVRLMRGSESYATDFNTNIPGDTYNPLPSDIPSDVNRYNYAVYYIIDSEDQKIYKRYVQDDAVSGHWEDYSFRIVVPFGVEITRDWTSKNYVYGIFLMDGTLYTDVMKNKVATLIVAETGVSYQTAYSQCMLMSEQELYDRILQDNIDQGIETDVALIDGREVVINPEDERWSPYWEVDMDIPMLNPAKITVKNDPIGGLL